MFCWKYHNNPITFIFEYIATIIYSSNTYFLSKTLN